MAAVRIEVFLLYDFSEDFGIACESSADTELASFNLMFCQSVVKPLQQSFVLYG